MEEKTVKQLADLVQTVGFPVLVAFWFMFRTDKRLEQMTEAINRLSSILAVKRKGDGA